MDHIFKLPPVETVVDTVFQAVLSELHRLHIQIRQEVNIDPIHAQQQVQ